MGKDAVSLDDADRSTFGGVGLGVASAFAGASEFGRLSVSIRSSFSGLGTLLVDLILMITSQDVIARALCRTVLCERRKLSC